MPHNDKLKQFLDQAFRPYGEFPARQDVEQELLANLTDKYNDLIAEGKTIDEAYRLTIESFGDVSEIMEHLPHDANTGKAGGAGVTKPSMIDRIKGIVTPADGRFRATALQEADLAGTDLSGNDFSMSALMGTDFSGSDLHGSTFKASALKSANFTDANLSQAVFDGSDIQEVSFDNADLAQAQLIRCALKGASFKDATLDKTEFRRSDLTGVSFDGMTLRGIVFDGAALPQASFRDATLEGVSFHHSNVKKTNFDGTIMDKVTYALLKSAKADLSNVTIR